MGSYQFSVSSVDGVRVFVDNTLLIDAWSDGSHNATAFAQLDAGYHAIRVEHYTGNGATLLQFSTDLRGQ